MVSHDIITARQAWGRSKRFMRATEINQIFLFCRISLRLLMLRWMGTERIERRLPFDDWVDS